ncbi:hypothetical protein SK3146_01918 [Paenibacillus konkukensis]|uniref:DUF4309 domain-containing protein n=2 Tax=Paenibacillus konkukensis TaxID=2020716 RepID=A0ABY4RKY3_9BACL|nr:DUF4309 domain-containing protein [Paenibacillus doosanensis]UQZ82758.1 hypothetical protein SK3146_01918 [Paenibacillus konkukensis]
MLNSSTYIARWLVPFILIMLITGCKNTSGAMQNPSPAPETPTPPTLAVTGQTVTEVPGDQATPTPAAHNPNDKVSLASAESGGKEEEQEPAKPPASKPKIDIQDPYNQAKPTLLGLTLKSSPETVTDKYGDPKQQFQMEDDTDPITVYDYTDFLVGFNKNNELQFIDIRSSEINPGLNGLKLGETTSDVFKALGKPDSNTSYVMTYKSKGAILKLDIDPKSDKINSIKLFAE